MKLSSLVLLAAFVAAPAAAQKEPAEVTDKEIAKYKAAALSGCQDAGIKKGDPKENVDAFCGCLVSTLDKSMTRAEWQRAYFHSLKSQGQEERQVLEPHLKNVGVCVPAAPAPQEQQPESQSAPQPKPSGGQGLRSPYR